MNNNLFEDDNIISTFKVTIGIQQRNNRQYITIISGIAEDLDLKKILRYFKKTYNCNGTILEDEKFGNIITLTGNQKDNVYNFFINEKIYNKNNIIIKG
jgi:translation initiation factor 1